MKRKAILIPTIIVLVFVALLAGLISSCAMPGQVTSIGGDRVGLLYIEGLITSGKGNELALVETGAASDHIVEVIQQAIDDKGIKALVLRINSPGGSLAASQEIFQAIKRFRDTNRPVIVSMADVAASGGYYIACAGSEIFADPSTLTGSIGVAMPLAGYEELFKKIGLEGSHDVGGKVQGNRKPDPSHDRRRKNSSPDNAQPDLRSVLGRCQGDEKIRRQQALDCGGGNNFNGQQAKDVGLIDSLGGLHEAVARAGELSGLGTKPTVEELGKTGLLNQLLGDMGSTGQSKLNLADVAGKIMDPTKVGENPFYLLWELNLVDPRLMGDESGVR